jgi:hypothetical protein
MTTLHYPGPYCIKLFQLQPILSTCAVQLTSSKTKRAKTTYKRGQPVVERDKLVSGKGSFKKHYYFFTPR